MDNKKMNNIVGRESEKYILQQLATSNESEFLAIYGRRRVGKTFLIREYFKESKIYFEITGLQSVPLKDQLNNFITTFSIQFSNNFSITSFWRDENSY